MRCETSRNSSHKHTQIILSWSKLWLIALKNSATNGNIFTTHTHSKSILRKNSVKWLNDANVFKFKSQMREKVASHVSPHVSAEVQIVGALTIISNLPRLLRLRLRELRHISTSFKSDKSVFWGSETFSSTSIWWSTGSAKWFPNLLYWDPITSNMFAYHARCLDLEK